MKRKLQNHFNTKKAQKEIDTIKAAEIVTHFKKH